ncbi:MAG: hypothetical protein HY695_00290 [Deltaproteobacteria bacterium]|nr:hypothetical protein [Deltaproteobacteria bacterium]
MNAALMTMTVVVGLGLVYVLLPLVVHTFQRYCSKRILQCPETQETVQVEIDPRRAAFSSAFGRPLLRVTNCTLWPKRKGCHQECTRSA